MPRKDVPPPLELVKSRIEEVLPPDAQGEIDRRRGRGRRYARARPLRGRGTSRARSTSRPARTARTATPSEFAAAFTEATGGKPALLYCGSGNRSARAADALTNEHGIEGVRSLIGGIKLWNDLGLPIEGEIAADEEETEEADD